MRIRTLTVFLIAVLATPLLMAEEMYVYPANGQTPDQQKADEYQCYDWAKGQSGFDPMQNHSVAAAPQQGGQVVKGAVAGAAVGAIVGDEKNDARNGAKVGAAAGLVRKNRQNRAAEQNQAAQQAQVQGNRDNYNKAYKACMSGRGYTIS